jgi:hypothetical protein
MLSHSYKKMVKAVDGRCACFGSAARPLNGLRVQKLLRFGDLFVDLIEQALLEAVDHH